MRSRPTTERSDLAGGTRSCRRWSPSTGSRWSAAVRRTPPGRALAGRALAGGGLLPPRSRRPTRQAGTGWARHGRARRARLRGCGRLSNGTRHCPAAPVGPAAPGMARRHWSAQQRQPGRLHWSAPCGIGACPVAFVCAAAPGRAAPRPTSFCCDDTSCHPVAQLGYWGRRPSAVRLFRLPALGPPAHPPSKRGGRPTARRPHLTRSWRLTLCALPGSGDFR